MINRSADTDCRPDRNNDKVSSGASGLDGSTSDVAREERQTISDEEQTKARAMKRVADESGPEKRDMSKPAFSQHSEIGRAHV